MNRYYRDVTVLEVRVGGKIIYQYIPEKLITPEMNKMQIAVEKKVQENYWRLNKDYPNGTWRN